MTVIGFEWNQQDDLVNHLKLVQNKTLILNNGEYKKFNPAIPPSLVKFNPAMTSNNTPSPYIATHSSTSGNAQYPYYAWAAFDGSNSFDASTTGAWISQVKSFTEEWISIYLGEKKKFVSYDLYCDTSDQAPKTWFIEGSNDNTGWEIIDSRSNITLLTSSTNTPANNFQMNNNKEFSYYRIRITAINTSVSSSNRVRINLLEFYESSEGEIASWKAVSNTIPTNQQFLEQGMDNLSPLLDRTVTKLEPMTMTDKSEILQVGEEGKVFSKTIDLKKYIDIRNIKTEVK